MTFAPSKSSSWWRARSSKPSTRTSKSSSTGQSRRKLRTTMRRSWPSKVTWRSLSIKPSWRSMRTILTRKTHLSPWQRRRDESCKASLRWSSETMLKMRPIPYRSSLACCGKTRTYSIALSMTSCWSTATTTTTHIGSRLSSCWNLWSTDSSSMWHRRCKTGEWWLFRKPLSSR